MATAAAMVVAVVVSGCTIAPGRMEDLADCGRISVGFGLGLEVHARAGCITQPAVGLASETYRFGHEDRETTGEWLEFAMAAPIASLMGGWMEPGRGEGWAALNFSSVRSFDQGDRFGYWLPVAGLPFMDEAHRDDALSFGELTDLEVGGSLLLVSGRVGINALEIVDFVLGFVGLDIAGDDPKPQPPPADSPAGVTPAPTDRSEARP